jgi:hypothetical protein
MGAGGINFLSAGFCAGVGFCIMIGGDCALGLGLVAIGLFNLAVGLAMGARR